MLKVLENKAWMERFLKENVNEMFRISALNSQDKAHSDKMERAFSNVVEQDVSWGMQNWGEVKQKGMGASEAAR